MRRPWMAAWSETEPIDVVKRNQELLTASVYQRLQEGSAECAVKVATDREEILNIFVRMSVATHFLFNR